MLAREAKEEEVFGKPSLWKAVNFSCPACLLQDCLWKDQRSSRSVGRKGGRDNISLVT